MVRIGKIVLWVALLYALGFLLVYVTKAETCWWQTELTSGPFIWHARLIQQPVIGQRYHVNGNIWTVVKTRRECK